MSNKETLEEFAKRIANDSKHSGIKLDYQDGIYYGIEIGAKYQAERMYSEEYVKLLMAETWIRCVGNNGNNFKEVRDKILKQFKKQNNEQ